MFRLINYIKLVKPERFFISAALCFELLLNIVTPPLQAPDEFNHFYRAYQISEGYFYPVKQDKRLGGYIPQGLLDFTDQYKQSAYIIEYTITYRELLNSFKINLNPNNRQFQDFPNTCCYSPISYLPQALALFTLRAFHAPPALLYYGGRLFMFLTWLFIMYFIIKGLPAFKWLFTALILLPMNLYLVNSFSADPVNTILSFLFISSIVRHVFITPKITRRHIFFLGLLLAAVILAKVVYVGLIVLLLLIPKSKFKSNPFRFLQLGMITAGCVITFLFWSNIVLTYYIPIKDYNPIYRDAACLSPCGDYYAQKDYILSHGFYFLSVCQHSLFDHPRTYLSGFIGVFGNGDVGLPEWIYWMSYAMLVLTAFVERNRLSFSFFQKVVVLSAVLSALVLILLSLHLVWDCVGEGIVDLVQGRYLLPLGPLVFLLFSNSRSSFQLNPALLIMPGIVMLNVVSYKTIYERFFIGAIQETKEIYCNAEKIDALGAFKTSDPEISWSGAGCQNNSQHRSGTCSARLSPASPFCFTYIIKNIKHGDIFEAEAWLKGENALLVFSGKQKQGEEFYFGNTFKSYRDKNGWQRIKNVCVFNLNCDSAEVGFYAWSPGKTDVYLDDVKLSIKRFK